MARSLPRGLLPRMREICVCWKRGLWISKAGKRTGRLCCKGRVMNVVQMLWCRPGQILPFHIPAKRAAFFLQIWKLAYCRVCNSYSFSSEALNTKLNYVRENCDRQVEALQKMIQVLIWKNSYLLGKEEMGHLDCPKTVSLSSQESEWSNKGPPLQRRPLW